MGTAGGGLNQQAAGFAGGPVNRFVIIPRHYLSSGKSLANEAPAAGRPVKPCRNRWHIHSGRIAEPIFPKVWDHARRPDDSKNVLKQLFKFYLFSTAMHRQIPGPGETVAWCGVSKIQGK